MLGAGRDGVDGRQVLPLEPVHARGGRLGAEVRVLAGALHDPAPPRVPGDVHHRREGPVDAGRGRLRRGDAGRLLDRRHVPARRLAERDREHRPVAVDHVEPEDHRDLEPAVLDRQLLHLPRGLGPGDVEDRADQPLTDLVVHDLLRAGAGRRPGHVEGAAVLVELADLLLERHLREQRVDLLLGGRVHEALGPGPRNESE